MRRFAAAGLLLWTTFLESVENQKRIVTVPFETQQWEAWTAPGEIDKPALEIADRFDL